MKPIFFKSYNALISVLISLLGFTTACDLNGGDSPAEYGTPHADFVIKGTITSAMSNAVIQNLKVTMKNDNPYMNDTVYTDVQGKYEVKTQGFGDAQTFHLVIDDIDGTANGAFQAKDSVIEIKREDITGGDGGWYEGKAEKIVNISLKPTVK